MLKLKRIGPTTTELLIGVHRVLFSYETPVASQDITSGLFFRTDKRWSVTTSKHINKWLDGADAVVKPQEFFERLANR